MVLEGRDVLVPAGQIAAHLHLNQLSQPGHILDLLLLQLQVSEEASNVESAFECDRVATGSLSQHHVINCGLIALSLVAVIILGDDAQDLLVGSILDGLDEGADIADVSELFVAFRVKVSNL